MAKFIIPVIISVIIIGGIIPLSFSSNPNLFVTPEIEQSGIFYGHQVVGVMVVDSDISETDEAKGEPDVTVNGKTLRMIQSVDGNWYGYFASRDHAIFADGVLDNGINFGKFCHDSTLILDGANNVDVFDTVGIAIDVSSNSSVEGSDVKFPPDPIPSTATCDSIDNPGSVGMNVIDDIPPINPDNGIGYAGQIGLNPELWPFIQLYSIQDGGLGAFIQYNKGGGAQTIHLDFLGEFPSTQGLVESIVLEVEDKSLSSKVEMKLLQPLEKILKNLNDDNPKNDKNICKSLDVFINKVKSQAGKQISFNDAQDLIDSTNQTKQIICN